MRGARRGAAGVRAAADARASLGRALKAAVEATGYGAASGVSDQPMGRSETRQGAINRARRAAEMFAEEHGAQPDFAVGLEGGVEDDAVHAEHGVGEDTLYCFAWMAIYSPASGRWGARPRCSRDAQSR